MKKIISILLLAIYLLSATQLSELLKLPLLVEHYWEHKQENKNLTFIGFLEIHYALGSPKDANYDKDMKLPFKTITNYSITSIYYFIPTPDKQNVIVYFKNDKQKFTDYRFTYSSSFISSIWQPPKSC